MANIDIEMQAHHENIRERIGISSRKLTPIIQTNALIKLIVMILPIIFYLLISAITFLEFSTDALSWTWTRRNRIQNTPMMAKAINVMKLKNAITVGCGQIHF